MKEGFDLWNSGNKSAALKMFGGAMSTMLPGGGLLFDLTDNLVGSVQEKGFLGGIKSFFGFGGDSGGDKGGDAIAQTQQGTRAFGTIPFKFKGQEEPKGRDKGFNPIRATRDFMRRMSSKKKYDGVKMYTPWNPNFEGLQPDMKLNFLNMAKEYFNKTGNNIQVNSGKRSGGGRSVHDYGWAIDINSNNANELEKMGLMGKYGFHRPLLHWNKKKEPWHIEPFPGEDVYGPRDTINNDFRINTLMNKSTSSVVPEQGGDEVNLPQGFVDKKIKQNKPMQVVLSNEDIDKLAMAFGEQVRKFKPNAPVLSNTPMASGRNL
jgi:hypothetical protein